MVNDTSYFIILPNQEEKINKEFNVTQKEVDEMIEMIKDWINLQPHLPKEKGEIFEARLKSLLRCNKMSVEKTKNKIDMYYSLKNFYPEFFDNKEPLHPRMVQSMKVGAGIPLRRPLDHMTRVHVFKLVDYDASKYNMEDMLSAGINNMELISRHDLCTNIVFIQDLRNWTMSHNIVSNPFTAAKLLKIFEKAFAQRISAVHYINAPGYAVVLINKFKTFLSNSKVLGRLHFHDKLEDLHKHIPKDILPSDLGGDDISIYDLNEKYIQYMQDHNDWYVELGKLRSNEKLRVGKPIDNELFGMSGSFRKLDID